MTIKIFLGNLSSDTTAEKIRPLFEKYGEVVECDVLKNFGFVHMVDKNDANKAIAQLDGHSIDGNNIRVELSTGKKGGGGGGGKFDKKGFQGGPGRSRPYGLPPGRGDARDYGRYDYPPVPPAAYDRYDPYYRYYMEREAYYARLGPVPGDRGYPSAGARDRYPPLPRDRLSERFPPDPRDRIPPPRPYLDERARGLADPYFRERDPLASRPPPEYYDSRKALAGGRTDSLGGSGAASGRNAPSGGYGNGVGGDYYRGLDRPGAGIGGASGGSAGVGGSDYFRQSGAAQSGYGRPGMGGLGGKAGDSQSSFAQDPIFF
ncbi:unnamed protein product [Candidula unifasciata]|uniref:RRM domain-containing protein n=1 Tax=Candidula unifasciata TaxID=100452 RepID=A0A8S3YQ27_9EUPU|nr:unnamed protein product [Candidula unifasciata]